MVYSKCRHYQQTAGIVGGGTPSPERCYYKSQQCRESSENGHITKMYRKLHQANKVQPEEEPSDADWTILFQMNFPSHIW